MLDLKLLRENSDLVQTKLDSRSGSYSVAPIVELDRQSRELEQQRSALQAKSNEVGKQVGQKMKSGSKPNDPEIVALKAEGNKVKAELAELEPKEKELKEQINTLLLELPNLPSDSTPIGKSEDDNPEISQWGDAHKPSHAVLPHYEVAEKLGILNTERATKVAQSRFVVLMGAGAALERALIQYMLDMQTKAGYVEVLPPVLINSTSMTATGQLPKFGEDSFKCVDDDLWLAPTAEVPVTNLYRDDVIDSAELPIHHCAYTPCFRREAGSYGRDTRGLIRLHQFNKVELVKLVRPETSEAEHQKLLQNAEAILQGLEMPYRVVELCTGDIGFGAQKCYDIEVWLPSADTYREISSCSNFGDFQARRGNIRFKEAGQKGTKFVHTLNGSGLAVGRTMAAVLENYQTEDGQVKVPKVLQPYLGREIL
ncbi:serine--tRNA ligase [filamentous cyanobacterium LEGE 11480]|uniref:Serine--tRNA ligase n=1 Tax=Romeriopsis navalis LEGE 11480 TaxID=2777977 RepID=A0A928Z3C9_9CYAN|nr:serine--tRNA ligase [Romeriopsis navalis]MBE9029180.1 serine--tRNA ligase [Romeriopsis navalis LEGE 11480]